MREAVSRMAVPKPPVGLATRGKRAWKELAVDGMAPEQVLLLEEVCRTADRLEELDSIIQGKGVLELMQFRVPHAVNDDGVVTVEVKFDSVLGEARQQQNVFKQMLVTVRQLAPGAKPQERGSRGAYGGQQSNGPATVKDEVGEKRAGRGWRSA